MEVPVPLLFAAPRPLLSAGSPPARHARAVVLGASVAGLLSAQVLSRRFAEVVVVDRDPLDGDLDDTRRGVPQVRQTHGLLVGGLQAIEDILPGYTAVVVARGGRAGDPAASTLWHMSGGPFVQFPSGLTGLLASRYLIESEIRRRVAANPGVLLLGGHDIVGLLASSDGHRVTGVRIAARPHASPAVATDEPHDVPTEPFRSVDLTGDLVVDATGRGSRAPSWMVELGYAAPPETVVTAGVSYSTRLFRERAGVLDDMNGLIVAPGPPDLRSGVALRQEGGHWIVTLAGVQGEQPPTELEAFSAYADGLPSPGLGEIVSRCEPIGEALIYRFPNSRWRHWEKLSRQPGRFIVIGDAVSSFNPVYGQGLTAAAQQAHALGALLDGDLDRLPRRAAKTFARITATPWMLTTGNDKRYPGQPRKSLPDRLLDRYLDRLLRSATTDPGAALAFHRVLNLLDQPQALLAPGIVRRVLRHAPSARTAAHPGSPHPAPS
jgi:2-polyprenyl-6-methoxyphenol hydroxylase-like FAD-dependent oxidoreductase